MCGKSQTFGENFSAWLSNLQSKCPEEYVELISFEEKTFPWITGSGSKKKPDGVWKLLLVLSKLNPSCLEENFKSFVGKKIVLITSSGNWAIFSRRFPKVFRQVVKTATFELPRCKFDAELFFVFKKRFIYLSISANEQTFYYSWERVFSGVVKIAFHVSKRSFLGKFWEIGSKIFLVNCSRPLRDKIKDFFAKNFQ